MITTPTDLTLVRENPSQTSGVAKNIHKSAHCDAVCSTAPRRKRRELLVPLTLILSKCLRNMFVSGLRRLRTLPLYHLVYLIRFEDL